MTCLRLHPAGLAATHRENRLLAQNARPGGFARQETQKKQSAERASEAPSPAIAAGVRVQGITKTLVANPVARSEAAEATSALRKQRIAERDAKVGAVPTPVAPAAVRPVQAPRVAAAPAPAVRPAAAPAPAPEAAAKKLYEERCKTVRELVTRCGDSIVAAKSPSDIDAVGKSIVAIEAFYRGIQGVAPQGITAAIATLRAAVELQRASIDYADATYTEGVARINLYIQAGRKDVAKRRAELNSLDFIERGIANISGTTQGMEDGIRAEENFVATALQGRQQIEDYRGYDRMPQVRIDGCIGIIRRSIRGANFTVANASLGTAISALTTADTSVRAAAEWIPGGALGVAIADCRINPNDPNNTRRLLGAVASTAIDLIPIPGARAAGNLGTRVGGRVGRYVAEEATTAAGRYVLNEAAGAVLDRTVAPPAPPPVAPPVAPVRPAPPVAPPRYAPAPVPPVTFDPSTLLPPSP